MSKYRIIEIKKDGYYKYYRMQGRYLLFFWADESGAFDEISEAHAYIKDQEAKQVITVVHEE